MRSLVAKILRVLNSAMSDMKFFPMRKMKLELLDLHSAVYSRVLLFGFRWTTPGLQACFRAKLESVALTEEKNASPSELNCDSSVASVFSINMETFSIICLDLLAPQSPSGPSEL